MIELRTHKVLSPGQPPVDGSEITCTACLAREFTADKTHRPDHIIAKHFQARGWEVSASGRDYCPACLKLRRGRKNVVKLKVPRVVAGREILPLNEVTLSRALSQIGLPCANAVREVGVRSGRRFEIKMPAHSELQVGMLVHAATEIEAVFQWRARTSYLKMRQETSIDGISVRVLASWVWNITVYPLPQVPDVMIPRAAAE